MAKFSLQINGQTHHVEAEPDTPLVWVLRENLNLRGTKFGCGINECGACTVKMGNDAVRSCDITVANSVGEEITTVEGLHNEQKDHPLQVAWMQHKVPQCGYCQPGMLMTADALLSRNNHPSEKEIDSEMSDVLCRCGTYPRVRQAVLQVAKKGGSK